MVPDTLWQSASGLEAFLRKNNFAFCFIGGIALQRWGQPRATRDLDLTLLTGFGNEDPFIQAILNEYDARIEDAASFARVNRILLVEDDNGTPIDISLGAMPFEERTVERSTIFEATSDCSISTCSAEDLIVHKAFANREQDWVDVRSILVRTEELDLSLIRSELAPLAELKGDEHIVRALEDRIRATR